MPTAARALSCLALCTPGGHVHDYSAIRDRVQHHHCDERVKGSMHGLSTVFENSNHLTVGISIRGWWADVHWEAVHGAVAGSSTFTPKFESPPET